MMLQRELFCKSNQPATHCILFFRYCAYLTAEGKEQTVMSGIFHPACRAAAEPGLGPRSPSLCT